MPSPSALHHQRSQSSFLSDVSSEHRPLLPGEVRADESGRGLLGSVSADLVPFEVIWRGVGRLIGLKGRARGVKLQEEVLDTEGQGADGGIQRRWRGDGDDGTVDGARASEALRGAETGQRLGISHAKHRPRLAGGGENLPLEILQSLSIWLSVLDARGVVPGELVFGWLREVLTIGMIEQEMRWEGCSDV